ncbi:MAG: phytanoyl-CoA dioxygenase family protein [Janthinobacterium sp.]
MRIFILILILQPKTQETAHAHHERRRNAARPLLARAGKLRPARLHRHRQPTFRDYFAQHCVQLPLSTGDAVFFNPALFHAAGHNRSPDIRRMANLLQASSPFGRAMEALDRRAMSVALYPALQTLRDQGALDDAGVGHAIAACAEGYAFPSNLDRDQPIAGMAPPTQQQLMPQAVERDWPLARLIDSLDSRAWRQRSGTTPG